MSTLYRYVHLLLMSSFFLAACKGQAAPAQLPAPNLTSYADLLGKPLADEKVADLLHASRCVEAIQAQLCKDIGVALWLDTDRVVREIYLYLNNDAGFIPYAGELPLALKFYDTLGAVEYKVLRSEADGNPTGLSRRWNVSGSSPDHLHYRVRYEAYGFTVIYNAPFPDEDATIYAVVLHS